MSERKEIKMSLGCFIAIVVVMVVLIVTIIIAGFNIMNKEKENQINESQKDIGIVSNTMKKTEDSNISNNQTTNETQDTIIDNEVIMSTQNKNTSTVTNNKTTTNVDSNITSNNNISSNSTSSYNPTETKTNNATAIDLKQYILYKTGKRGKMDKDDLDYNTVLRSEINPDKDVNSVTNYTSSMKWSVYSNSDYSIEYPTGWTVEYPTNGIEEIRVSGKLVGKQAVDAGVNGDKVVEAETILVAYKAVTCTLEEINQIGLEQDYCGAIEGEYGRWTQTSLEGKNVNALDNYQFIDNGDGTYKVIKTRVLNSNDEETTHKTLNLETHFVCETKVK